MFKRIILWIAILGLSACGRISIYKYRAHDITAPDVAKISMLYVSREIFVHEIDGNGKYSPGYSSDLFPYSAAEIELLPGTHTLSLKYASGRQYSLNKSNITYNFLPGRKYFIQSKIHYSKTETNTPQSSVLYRIEECGTKEEAEYNDSAKKSDSWLAPYVPACGK